MGNLNSQRPPNPPLKVNILFQRFCRRYSYERWSIRKIRILRPYRLLHEQRPIPGKMPEAMKTLMKQIVWCSLTDNLSNSFLQPACTKAKSMAKTNCCTSATGLSKLLTVQKSLVLCYSTKVFSFADENLCSHMMALGNFITATIVIWVWQIVWSIFIGHMRRRLNHIFSIRSMH